MHGLSVGTMHAHNSISLGYFLRPLDSFVCLWCPVWGGHYTQLRATYVHYILEDEMKSCTNRGSISALLAAGR
jgi:hypothetical protein